VLGPPPRLPPRLELALQQESIMQTQAQESGAVWELWGTQQRWADAPPPEGPRHRPESHASRC
jgi:hypothetical protein